MRSTPAIDARLRELLKAAVDRFSDGSADAFGQFIGYANGGYIREVLNNKKPVREALIERVHAKKELRGWFDEALSGAGVDLIGGGRDIAEAKRTGPSVGVASLREAFDLVARCFAGMDPTTRAAAATALSRLADHPESSIEVMALLERLANPHQVPTPASDTPPSPGAHDAPAAHTPSRRNPTDWPKQAGLVSPIGKKPSQKKGGSRNAS